MKKITSVFIIITMLANQSYALEKSFNHNAEIEKAFNQFRYQMTVEVDPANKDYQNLAKESFRDKIIMLHDKGVTTEQIVEYMRSNTLDASARADFDRLISSMDMDTITSEDAGNLAMKFMASKYQKGANYSGGQGRQKWALIVIGVVIVGVVTYYLIKKHRENKCEDNTKTITNTVTSTSTNTDTNYGYCCNTSSGNVVPASPTGCENGTALVFVNTPEECEKDKDLVEFSI